ncbi:hypothetical protein, partial [uncultured Dubosiella sp.]|uniref:hypothetical protein n=1 Tax=uncultured Dubosiella sp. TaxID=1937011 RepID=UPI0025A5815E
TLQDEIIDAIQNNELDDAFHKIQDLVLRDRTTTLPLARFFCVSIKQKFEGWRFFLPFLLTYYRIG